MSRQELRSTGGNCQGDDRQESCSSAGNCQADEQTVITQSWIRDEVMFRQWCADRFGQYPISPQDLIGHYRQMEQEDWFFPFTSFDETGPAGHLILRFTDERKETLRVGFVITDLNRRSQ